MTRLRRWLLTAGITLALLLPLGSIASADPGDTGFGNDGSSGSGWSRPERTDSTSSDPGDTGFPDP